MKKAILIFTLLLFILQTSFVLSEEITVPVTKVALKYQGETTYRQYDIPSVNFVFDNLNPPATYGPTSICTLTDEANNLPSGVITEIKLYGTVGDSTGWIVSGGLPDPNSPDNAINWLGSNIDLSTIKRKKVTVKFYSNGSATVTTTPSEENL